MDPGEIEALIHCLVANPHDTDALARAHLQGETDPQGYAYLLEQVGTRTDDPSYASHWLSEAANIWSITLGDAHRAARVLMIAVDRDPTQALAADRLAQLYREKGDVKALVAMLDRRVRLLTPMLASNAGNPAQTDSLRSLLATLHEELGKLWNEPPLEQPRKAIDHYKRSIEFDPASAFAIFSLREIFKSLQQWDEAISLYGMELALERAPDRRLLLARDEAATRRLAGDLVGVTQVLRTALEEVRSTGGDDPVLAQEVAGSILDRAEAGAPLDEAERAYGADTLARLAEAFDGEHGLAYAAGALDLVPGHDRAMQLFAYYSAAASNGAPNDALSLRFHAYLGVNPNGALAADARLHLAGSYEALGQIAQALQVLQPLRGQPDIDVKVAALQRRAQSHAALTPVAGVQGLASSMSDVPDAPDTDEVSQLSPRAPPAAPSPPAVRDAALEAARAAVAKSDKAGALERYLEVLAIDPVEPEALSWAEDALRAKRDYAKLRDVLWASARAMSSHDSLEGKKLRLREIAGLSESNLKDVDGAIQAWRQLLSLDRGDDAARQALTRALEKAQRWDDLANLYEQEASTSADVDVKIQLEKKLAQLHDQKRSDPLAAAEAWGRIASLTPEDDHALTTATELFEKAGKPELAAGVIEDHVEGVTDASARATLLEKLGGLLEKGAGDAAAFAAAGRAYKRAAEVGPSDARWSAAEQQFARAESWPLAAEAADRLAELQGGTASATEKAAVLARAARYLREAGDDLAATKRLEAAHALAPAVDEYALALIDRYKQIDDAPTLAAFLVARGASHADGAVRGAALREAAKLYQAPPLGDEEAARAQWRKLLESGEDAEALDNLERIAEKRGELADAAALLGRLGALAKTKSERTELALREADLLARSPDGAGPAVQRYEAILDELDPTNRVALRAIADLELARGAPKAAANALERELAVADGAAARREVSARLVEAYAAAGDDAGTFAALKGLREADPEDFEALGRMVGLAEKLERWEPLVDLLAQQVEVEADENEISSLTRRRAALLADKLGRGDEALAVLQEIADSGDVPGREAYIELGDKLGWRGIVATKLVDWWFPEAASPARTAALKGAFERFAVVGRDADAVRVGVEILRGARDAELAQQLEALAVKTSDDVGLTAAQEILGLELTGAARAAELVRQAELRTRAGMAWTESVQHGETGLGGLSPEEASPLLARLAALIPEPPAVIDLYERQVSRARGGSAREKALIQAAQIAGNLGDLKRARVFFDLALTGTPSEATIDALIQAAGEADNPAGLRRALAEALSQGGGGVRDGGRSRANLLRRAAAVAQHDLHDVDQAFAWLTDALIAHADVATLDALGTLAEEEKTPKRIDEVLGKVLGEVFDGPLVRLVLARRAKVRKEILEDRAGAAADLKKLHDLSPNDEAVMAELFALLTEQGDHRAMVQLYEDQILRSKDQAVRAELARKVAQIWEGQLGDPREAADGWRRVLRLKPGDEEATQGLDRAKTNMLRKGPPPAAAAPPPAAGAAPPPAATSSAPPRISTSGMPAVVPPPPTSSTPTRSSTSGMPAVIPPAPTSSTPTRSSTSGMPAVVPPPPTSSSPSRGSAPSREAAAPPAPVSSTPGRKSAPTLAVAAVPVGVPDPSTAVRSAAPPSRGLVPPATTSAPDTVETRSVPRPADGLHIPADAPSVEDVDESDLEPDEPEATAGSFDLFSEADATHTSIDVRLPKAAALALDTTPPVGAPPLAALGTSSSEGPASFRRPVAPPPLPPVTDEQNEFPTSPGRRLDPLEIGGARSPTSDRALAMTDRNPTVDFSDGVPPEVAAVLAAEIPQHHKVPADVLSVTDLAADDDDDDDLLVVDEFVADADDEFEDVVEPSKPPGPLQQ